MAASTLASVFERLQSKDKDFRYMATSDLTELLRKPEWRRDDDTENRLCELILAQLDDSSGDVSSLAVKCLGLLVRKVHKDRAERILEFLCTKVLTGKKEQDREIASIALTTVIGEVSGSELSCLIVSQVVPKMLQGMQAQDQVDVATSCLDIMNEVLAKFGQLLTTEQGPLKTILLQQLSSSKTGIRKRAMACLGAVVPYVPNALLDEIAEELFARMKTCTSQADATRTFVQALGTLGRSAGWRFGRHLSRAVPVVVSCWQAAREGDDEMREFSLQALEAFVLRCSQDAKQHLEPILNVVLQSLSYDPNYTDDMEEDTGDDNAEEEAMSDDDYTDDDDVSWKVRRAASMCLVAVFNNYADMLLTLYRSACPALVGRFKEREENVKMDIFNAFIVLVHQVSVFATKAGGAQGPEVLHMLQSDCGDILRASCRQLRDKSVKTRTGVFLTLKELLTVVPGCLSTDVDQVLPAVTSALNDRSSTSSQLKIHALQFLQAALATSNAAAWQPHLMKLLQPVTTTAGERYSKVAAEALRVCEELVHIIRSAAAPSMQLPASMKALIGPLVHCVTERLGAQDQEQEVKECAMSCAAAMAAELGTELGGDLSTLLKHLLERLQNEATRLPAVRAFTKIAQSPLPLDLSNILEVLLTELTSYLRKANRQLRQASLAAIEAVMARQGSAVSSSTVSAAVDAVMELVSDADLLITPMALRFFHTLLPQQRHVAAEVSSKCLPAVLQLVKSPLLQGAALEEVLAFFPAILASQAHDAAFDSLLTSLLAAGDAPETGKAAQHNVAQCIANLTVAAGPSQVTVVVKGLLAQLQTGSSKWAPQGETRGRKRSATEESPPGAENVRRLALLCIGEIGRRKNLSEFPQLQLSLTHALLSTSEDIRAAASLALGGVSVGDMDAYLPFLIQQIDEQAESPKDQYLLLKALNEVIVSLTAMGSTKALDDKHQSEVLRVLLANCSVEEECRNVVAECMGHLALLFPMQVLPALQQRQSAPEASTRAAIVTAVKFAIVPEPHPIDDTLHTSIAPFLDLVSDPDRVVRKAAVQMLSSAAHGKAALVADHLPGVMPRVYQQTIVNEALIRTVDLGPFKHKIDDGLELRKAAFECMDVLLDNCVDRLDFQAFISHIESGLKDHYDVKLSCHLLLAKLAAAAPGQLLAALDSLVEPLERTLTFKNKSEAVKQEVDRNEDMIRSALRAVDAISYVPNVDICAPFKHLLNNVVLQGALANKYKAVREERAEAEGVSLSVGM